MPHIVVIGGGITGLSAAYRLSRSLGKGVTFSLYEAAGRFGGVIQTIEENQCLIELGPDSFLSSKPWLIELCRQLGIQDRVTPTNRQFRRSSVVFRGKLHPLPEGFLMMAPTQFLPLVRSSLFSWTGKLRMGLDLLLPRGSKTDDESLGAFVRRRLGQEALDRVAQPLIGGIYTGDPDQLSLRATMPRFLEMEAQHRSVILAMWRQRREAQRKQQSDSSDSGARYSELVSFDRGIQTVIDRLVERLPPEALHCNCSVTQIERTDKRWRLTLSDGRMEFADGVILALPASRSAALLKGMDAGLAAELDEIPHASSTILNIGYRLSDIPHPMNGFGFVVPTVEHRRIIACSYSHVKFRGRVPESLALLRAFVGGATQPHLFNLDDNELIRVVREELRDLIGVTAEPVFTRISRYPASMPQYRVGHTTLVTRIRTLAAEHYGLALAGNAYEGVGLPDCVRSGQSAADSLLKAFLPSD